MRIILSRKGVDSGTGGIPSPILDGRLVSLPIPGESQIQYRHLRFGGISLGKVAEDLSHGALRATSNVHLDPDLCREAYPRKPGWRPIFGQGQPGAESHLQRCGVSVGDLFLFYGWFREAELKSGGRYRYKRSAPNVHVIYGWLQVGAVIFCDDPIRSCLNWARYHPHFCGADGTAYIALSNLNLGSALVHLKGGGVFRNYCDGLRLTAPDCQQRGIWQLPQWFYPRNGCCPLTYHPDKKSFRRTGYRVRLKSAARGQEFVLDARDYPEALSWARRILLRGCAVS